jgi:hypothetical protein
MRPIRRLQRRRNTCDAKKSNLPRPSEWRRKLSGRWKKLHCSRIGRRGELSTNGGLQQQCQRQGICSINELSPVCLHHQALIQGGFCGSIPTYVRRTKQLCVNADMQSREGGNLSHCCAPHPSPRCTSEIHATTSTSPPMIEIQMLRQGDNSTRCPTALGEGAVIGYLLVFKDPLHVVVPPCKAF